MDAQFFKWARRILIPFVASLCIAFSASVAYAESTADGTVVLNPVGYRNYLDGANGFDVTLSYDGPIKCGVKTTFTVQASGRSGEYKYMVYSLTESGKYDSLQDFSYMGMRDSNEITITFDYNCDYDLAIQVSDKDNLAVYTRPIFRFTVSDSDAAHKDDLSSKAESIANQVSLGCMSQGFSTQYDKALWLHDWIIDNCEYDGTYRHAQAYDLFVFGTGTCEAYHAAYMDLLGRVGIECGRVSDRGHVWTLAKLDGEWCHIDTTGETASGKDVLLGELSRHKLFGLNDSIIVAKLVGEDPENGIRFKDPNVEATSLKNNYIVRTGKIHQYSDAYRDDVQACLDQGKSSFDLTVNNADWPKSYKTIINSLVAYQLSTERFYRDGKAVSVEVEYGNDTLSFSLPSKQAMYRLYNPNSGEHFYTASSFERDSLVRVGWRYEGIGWYAPAAGADVYRLYNPNAGDHHYTTSAGERDNLVKVGWKYEGVGWKSGGSVPLYRQYNPNAATGAHNFTTSKAEHNWLATMGWRREGIAWYGVG